MEAAGDVLAWALALESSALAAMVRQSTWIYPLANILHVLGVALLFGSIAVFDLRLLGITRSGRPDLVRDLALPLSRLGVATALLTGAVLFMAEASAYIVNPVFQVKLAAIAIALINLAIFHAGSFRRIEAMAAPPPAARLAAGISLAAWLAALVCGRLTAYL